MKKSKYIFVSLLTLCLTGCIFFNNIKPVDPDDPDNPDDPPVVEPLILDPDFSPVIRNNKSEVTYNDLFNLNNKVSIDIDIARSELELIQEDNNKGAKPEMYRVANKVTISLVNGENTFTWEFDKVGIRQKGNTSRQSIFKDDKVNTHNHYKLSFDETFTDTTMYDAEYISLYGDPDLEDRDFLGLSGLDFKWNKNYDQTHIKEIYATDMFRAAGVMVQHAGLATIKMHYDNDQVANFGLCTLYEPTSKSIIKRTLSSSDKYINMPSWSQEKNGTYGVSNKKYGDFYKGTYGRGNGGTGNGVDLSTSSISGERVGVKTDVYGNNIPAYERKTNTEAAYNDSLLKTMVNTLANKEYDKIDELVDLKYFAMEEAVAYFVGNPDSFRYNYNNTMFYFRRTDGKMVILPIDSDRCLGIGKDWDKGTTFCAASYVTPLYKGDVWNNNNHNPLFYKVLTASNENQCQKDFKQYIGLVRESKWVLNNTFESLYNIAKNTYNAEAEFTLNNRSEEHTSELQSPS